VTSWWFEGWFFYLGMSVKPPQKMTIFQKITYCLNPENHMGGLTSRRKSDS